MLVKYNNNIYWEFDTEDNKFKMHRYSFKNGWQTEKIIMELIIQK